MQNKHLHILLINGHGGINPSKKMYVTPGKRSPVWKDGRQLFEGVFNRKVVSLLVEMCNKEGIPVENLVPEWQDISLQERVKRVNNAAKGKNNALMLEIHANAATSSQANGFEFFTPKGLRPSDFIADVMIEEYAETIPSIRLRTDGGITKNKESDFYVTKRTDIQVPSVLIECAFMTNEKECKMMLDKPELFAEAIFNGILAVKGKFG